jgi:hypothetical protein
MNEYIKDRRAKFAEQLKDPKIRADVAAMMVSEDESHPLPVVESLMNRCDYAGKTLEQMLHSGFYGPINRGKLPHFLSVLKLNPEVKARMNAAIDQALAGSNTIQGFTDQGLPTDPNGRWPGGLYIHGEIFNDWGGGPGGHAGAKSWRLKFNAFAEAADDAAKTGLSPAGYPVASQST